MENSSSSAVEREREYLRFILVGKRIQSLLLLRNITLSQTNAVSEIFLNILHSEEIEEQTVKSLERHRILIRKIGQASTNSNTERRKLIQRHSKVVLKILLQVESILPWDE